MPQLAPPPEHVDIDADTPDLLAQASPSVNETDGCDFHVEQNPSQPATVPTPQMSLGSEHGTDNTRAKRPRSIDGDEPAEKRVRDYYSQPYRKARRREWRQLQKERARVSGTISKSASKFLANTTTWEVNIPQGAATGPTHTEEELLNHKAPKSLENLIEEGFAIRKWDGGTPVAIVDQNGKIICTLAGQPQSTGWEKDSKALGALLENIAPKFDREGRKDLAHEQGLFLSDQVGITLDHGNLEPSYICTSDTLEEVLAHPGAVRAKGFAESSLRNYSIANFKYYMAITTFLSQIQPPLPHANLKPLFQMTAVNWPTAKPGDHTSCMPAHRDIHSLPNNWCAIQAHGDFDPELGGHLVLHDLKLAIEFPAGSIVLIPSAVLLYSNVPVRPHETRSSITWYTPSSLCHWVDNGGMVDQVLKERDYEKWKEMESKKAGRWKEAYEQWTDWSTFLAGCKPAC